MINLLSAGFARLFKDKIFWICNAALFVIGVYMAIDRYLASKLYDSYKLIADEIVFLFLAYGGIVYAVFCTLFIGREYSDGTMRNKLMIGHTRVAIFFSTLVVAAVGNVIISLAYIIPAAVIGVSTLGWFERPTELIVVTFIALLILAVAYAAVFTVLSLLNSNKAVNSVICIILVLALVITASKMFSALQKPETYSPATFIEVDENGEMYELISEEVPNPYYISGLKRQIYQVLIDLSPGGQSMLLSSLYSENPEILALYSAGLTVVTAAIGLVLFKRKDIK